MPASWDFSIGFRVSGVCVDRYGLILNQQIRWAEASRCLPYCILVSIEAVAYLLAFVVEIPVAVLSLRWEKICPDWRIRYTEMHDMYVFMYINVILYVNCATRRCHTVFLLYSGL